MSVACFTGYKAQLKCMKITAYILGVYVLDVSHTELSKEHGRLHGFHKC